MTNKSWVSFGSSIKTSESTFNQPIAGSSLGKGTHEAVTIEGIEPGTNPEYPAMRITWSKDGESKTDNVFFLNYDKDGLSNQYLALATALCGDVTLRQEFFGKIAPNKPEVFNALVGCKANIKIDYKKVKSPETKYKIVNLNDGNYQIVDAFDDETVPSDIPTAFSSYEDAKNEADANGLALTYMNVLRVTPIADKEELAAQTERLRAAISSKPKAVSSTF